MAPRIQDARSSACNWWQSKGLAGMGSLPSWAFSEGNAGRRPPPARPLCFTPRRRPQPGVTGPITPSQQSAHLGPPHDGVSEEEKEEGAVVERRNSTRAALLAPFVRMRLGRLTRQIPSGCEKKGVTRPLTLALAHALSAPTHNPRTAMSATATAPAGKKEETRLASSRAPPPPPVARALSLALCTPSPVLAAPSEGLRTYAPRSTSRRD